MALKTNPFKVDLAKGRVQIGTWINMVRNPSILTLLKNTGLDYARIDMEHSSLSIETLAQMAVLSRALDFPILVRKSGMGYSITGCRSVGNPCPPSG